MTNLYDTDFYEWTREQAAALAAGKVDRLDFEHLAEEIEGLGRSDRRALASDLRIVLLHMLKWRYQAERQSDSWQESIDEHRLRIDAILDDSPSLRREVPDLTPQAYAQARKRASTQTRLPLATFPETCPWTPDEVLDEDFYPKALT